MMTCETCEGTGRCCGADDCATKCADCYCVECTFAPCQCGARFIENMEAEKVIQKKGIDLAFRAIWLYWKGLITLGKLSETLDQSPPFVRKVFVEAADMMRAAKTDERKD